MRRHGCQAMQSCGLGRWPMLLIAVQVLGCGTSEEPCVNHPEVVLQQSMFTELAVNAATSFSFLLPQDHEYRVSVQWTPRGNSTLLAISDHPCSTKDLKAGACSLDASTGSTGSASLYLLGAFHPGTTYTVYVVNVGTEAESGTIQFIANSYWTGGFGGLFCGPLL